MYGTLNSAQLELVQISKKFLESVLKSPFHRLYRPDLSDSFLFPDQQTATTEFATSLIARNPSHFPAELLSTDPPAPKKRPRIEKANESLMRIKSQEEGDEAGSQDEEDDNLSAEESDSESISVGDSASEKSDGEQLL